MNLKARIIEKDTLEQMFNIRKDFNTGSMAGKKEIKVKKEMNSKYVCPICGEVYYSDFPYLVGYCLNDNAEMKRQEAEKPCCKQG